MTRDAKPASGNFGNGPGPFATSGSSSLSNNKSSDDLTAALGHAFRDAGLLQRALTHSSTGKADNEQLEFLGDRVLGFVVAEMLVTQFPSEREGDLALKLNALVRMETCARVAEAAGLDRHLILAPSEDRSGGRKKPAILGDVCEAVIAALYFDGGIKAARAFIVRYWQPLLTDVQGDLRDPKNVLQEWAQARALGTPSYRVAKREGPDHAPRFTVEVRIDTHEPAQGEGNSLRAAEQAAARALMKRLEV
jgi:ribonuclease-3